MIQPTKPYQLVSGDSTGNNITCNELYSTITNLQTSTGSIYPIVFISDNTKEGIFEYDATDTTTADDGYNTIVTTTGKRYKRVDRVSKVNTVADLRNTSGGSLNLVFALCHTSNNDNGQGTFYWDAASTLSDNNGTVIAVTGISVGRWIRVVVDNYYVEWFGAKGDGATNDYTAITSCINYVASLSKGGTIQFLAKTYLTSPFFIKKNVSMVGASRSLAAGADSILNGTTLKNYSSTFSTNFVELYPDRTYPQQNGEVTNLAKSYPNITISNISFDASNVANYALTMLEAWGFTIDSCKFYRGKLYSLNITDCNEFNLLNSSIKGFLSISNADYIIENNDIAGGINTPAAYLDRTGNGTLGNNKIYFGGSVLPPIKFNVANLVNGVFQVTPFNYLTPNPTYISTAGTSSFIQETQTLNIISVDGVLASAYSSLTYGILQAGVAYRLVGTVRVSGASSNREVVFSTTDNSVIYGTVNATTSVQSFDFTFTPTSNIANTILKIKASAASVTGTDAIILTDVKIISDVSILDGVPVIFNYPNTVTNGLKASYPHSESYYPKFLTATTVVLYNNLYNFTNVPSGYVNTSETFLGGSIEVPSAVMLITGRNSNTGVYSSNKIEDVVGNGIVLRGAYNNVFSGNTLSKAISKYDSKLLVLEKGATKNTISSNSISARTENLNDITYIGVYIDEFSGNNTITSNTILDCAYLDVCDEFIGETASLNIYDNLKMSMCYRRKAIDYICNKDGVVFEKDRITKISNNGILITSTLTEYSLHFDDVKIYNVTSDATLFQQKDISFTQNGRFAIRISAAGAVYCVINAIPIVSTANGVVVSGKYYNITVVKDSLNNWAIYIDGILAASDNTVLTVATSLGTKSYIGSGDISQGCDVFLTGFKFFTEALIDKEIRNLNFQESVGNRAFTSLASESVNGVGIISSSSNGTISSSSSTGIDGGDSLLFGASLNNIYNVNVLGNASGIKGNVVRISGYIKSSTATVLAIGRNNKFKNIPITSTYTKFVQYITPDSAYPAYDALIFKFGTLNNSVYTKDFLSAAGSTFIDTLNIGVGYYPISVILDFSKNITDYTIYNKLLQTDSYTVASNQGSSIVKMTTAEMQAVPNPALGLLIYNTDLNTICHYNGTTWTNYENIVTSIANLRLKSGASNGAKCYLSGYSGTPNDGAQGYFYWNATSTDNDNGGTVIQVTGITTGRWIRITEFAYYSKWFGAKGDGITDDTTAIQKWLDVSAAANKPAIANNGNYLVETIYIPYGIDMRGSGFLEASNLEKTTFTQKTTNDVFRLNGNLNTGFYWFFGKLSNFRIYGNTASTTGIGLHCMDASNNKVLLQDVTVIEDLVVRGMGSDGICNYGAMPAIFNRLKLLFNNGAGIHFVHYDQFLGVALHNISGDGNSYLLQFDSLTETDNVSIVNLKSENRTDPSHGNTDKQFNAIYFNNCAGTYNIDGANHISSVLTAGSPTKPGALILIAGANKPHITWRGVNTKVVSGSAGTDPLIIEGGGFLSDNIAYTYRNGSYNSKFANIISEAVNFRTNVTDGNTTPDSTGTNILLFANSTNISISNLLGGVDSKIVTLLFTTAGTSITSNVNFALNKSFVSTSNASITLIYYAGTWKELSRSVNEGLQAPVGTVAAPSLSIIGDANTGVNSSGADTISLVTGGVEALKADSSQNVSIGTTTGVNSLGVTKVITGGTDVSGIRSSGQIQTDVTGNAYLFRAILNQIAAAVTTSVFGFDTALGTISGTITNITNFRATLSGGVNAVGFQVTGIAGSSNTKGFDSNISSGTNKWNAYFQGTAQNYLEGSLGLGIQVPLTKMHIYTTDANMLRLERAGLGISNIFISVLMTGSTSDTLFDAATASSGFLFRTKNASNTAVNALGIDKNGNVGIKTLAPSADFEINGVAKTKGLVLGITTQTSAYSILTTDYTIRCDATSAAFAVTLPTASTCTGQVFVIKKIDSSANAVTINGTLDGTASRTLTTQYSSYTVQSNGTTYDII
jgi:hypothetical protein